MLRLEKIDKTMYSFLETEEVLVKIPSPGGITVKVFENKLTPVTFEFMFTVL